MKQVNFEKGKGFSYITYIVKKRKKAIKKHEK